MEQFFSFSDLPKPQHKYTNIVYMCFSLFSYFLDISKSQNDMAVETCLLTADYGQEMELRKEKRSQSDTAIDIGTRVFAHILKGSLESKCIQ